MKNLDWVFVHDLPDELNRRASIDDFRISGESNIELEVGFLVELAEGERGVCSFASETALRKKKIRKESVENIERE